MFKKVLTGGLVGLVFAATLAFGGQIEDFLNRNMITPVLQGYSTAGLPTVGVRGHLAFDTTLGTPTVDDGAVWAPLTTRSLARIASHFEVTQTTAPTVSSCTGGTVVTGSSDTTGRVSGMTASTCTVLFNNRFINTPFVLVSGGLNGGNALRAQSFVTGIDIANIGTASSEFTWLAVGYY